MTLARAKKYFEKCSNTTKCVTVRSQGRRRKTIKESEKKYASRNLHNEDWLLRMLNMFDHPSTALWRAVEARCIEDAISNISFKVPILDLGCGEGKLSSSIFSREKSCVGLDISKEDITNAKRLKSYEGLIVADARNLPFQNGCFDAVFSNCVIEHIPRIDEVLSEVSRISKEDGIFLFTVPSELFGEYLFVRVLLEKIGLRRLARSYSKRRNEALNHYNIYNIAAWEHKIMNANLNIVKFRYYLSRSAVEIWDFMAICIFSMRRLFGTKLFKLLSVRSKGIRISIFRKILFKYYDQNCQVGGGLLIVAKKSMVDKACNLVSGFSQHVSP